LQKWKGEVMPSAHELLTQMEATMNTINYLIARLQEEKKANEIYQKYCQILGGDINGYNQVRAEVEAAEIAAQKAAQEAVLKMLDQHKSNLVDARGQKL